MRKLEGKVKILLHFMILLFVIGIMNCSKTTEPEEQETILEINVLLNPFFNHNLNVTQVNIKISRETYSDSVSVTTIDSVITIQFSNIDAGVYYIDYEIYVDSILTVSGTTDGVSEPNVTSTVNIDENDWGEIPPTIIIDFRSGFEYKESMGYYTAIYDINNPFTIDFEINENGNDITKLYFDLYQSTGIWYYWIWENNFPDCFTNTRPYGFGRFNPSAVLEFGESSEITSNHLEFYGYMNYYESPIINDTIYSFKIDPSKDIFSELWNINATNISEIYIAGYFNDWIWENDEYRLIQNASFYEIMLSNVSSNQEYKFVVKYINGNEHWVPDVVNYRMTDDGYGGYNSITP